MHTYNANDCLQLGKVLSLRPRFLTSPHKWLDLQFNETNYSYDILLMQILFLLSFKNFCQKPAERKAKRKYFSKVLWLIGGISSTTKALQSLKNFQVYSRTFVF